ncbi:MAG: ACT domain-containing protein [Clostridiaceae bacterium]|jgi:ACT domain-containing protein|nr:ACT domain-containing protein [Clostridiaceae bacterium]
MNAVVTVLGKDKVGIIAGISRILSQANVNILDITQTTMQDLFTMTMLTDMTDANIAFSELSDSLEAAGRDMGLYVKIQHEDIFNTMHRI